VVLDLQYTRRIVVAICVRVMSEYWRQRRSHHRGDGRNLAFGVCEDPDPVAAVRRGQGLVRAAGLYGGERVPRLEGPRGRGGGLAHEARPVVRHLQRRADAENKKCSGIPASMHGKALAISLFRKIVENKFIDAIVLYNVVVYSLLIAVYHIIDFKHHFNLPEGTKPTTPVIMYFTFMTHANVMAGEITPRTDLARALMSIHILVTWGFIIALLAPSVMTLGKLVDMKSAMITR